MPYDNPTHSTCRRLFRGPSDIVLQSGELVTALYAIVTIKFRTNMTDLATPCTTTVRRGRLRCNAMEEPFNNRFPGKDRNADEIARLNHDLLKRPEGGPILTLALCLSDDDNSSSLSCVLDFADFGARIVPTFATGAAPQKSRLTPGYPLADAERRSLKSVVVEHDVPHVVIVSMQRLTLGGNNVVLIPDHVLPKQILRWLKRGAHWQGSCEASDEICFYSLAA